MSTLFFKIKRKLYKLFHPAWGEILMLHRVVQKRSQLEANKQMEITPEFLEKMILDYQARGYQFVSLDEVHEIVSNQKKLKQKFVCFTFDDGYADNYELAYPVFKKYNCPFAIYVATDFPDGKALLWWYVLEDILLQHTELVLGDGSWYDCSTIEEKNETFVVVKQKIFDSQSRKLEQVLNKLLGNYSFSFEDKNKALVLTWEQIGILATDQLCTIASHTVSHGVLPNMSIEEVEVELKESKLKLEKQIGKEVVHFAYPYGAWNDSVLRQVIAAEYKTATLANGGKVRLKKRSEFVIKRISLEE
jgi:peptidoglycan/xylan/chitin deacetylase (PgdA/CDA1 family)